MKPLSTTKAVAMKPLIALYRATAREFLRDRTVILITVLLPLVMAIFFGMLFGKGGDTLQSELYVPGMLGLALLWLGVFGVAPPLVQQREQQVLRRIGVTPVSRATFLGAQLAWRLTTGLIQAAVLIAYGVVAYHMAIVSPLLTLAAAVLGAATLVAIGLLLASLARTNESVVALGQLVQFPMMFLSGILFPLAMLPSFLQPVARAMPLTYLGDALRQTMLGAPPLFPLWLDFSVLGGCLLVIGGVSLRIFRWE